TLQTLKSHRMHVFEPAVSDHNGRIVKTTGDGLLIEFASAVDAVQCAVDIQRSMAALNAAIPTERRIDFRIGINVGDIIVDGHDIYGDGVMLRPGWKQWQTRAASTCHVRCATRFAIRSPMSSTTSAT